jgi:hypothetical protein
VEEPLVALTMEVVVELEVLHIKTIIQLLQVLIL